MRKFLSLSLGMLTAASSFAAVKTVTIPAVPDGKKACTFVVKEIPEELGLEENELFPAHMGLVGKEFTKDTTVSFWISSEETLVCNVSTGKRPSVITRDTSICVNKDINPEVLGQFTPGTYWGQNKFTGNSYVEVNSTCINQVTPDYIVYYDDSIPAPVDQDMIRPIRPDSFNIDPDANPVIPVYVPLRYLFTITDTITGCDASSIAKVTFKDCDAPIQWQNYSGPKEYKEYRSDDYLSYLKGDSIMAVDPLVNCICPLPLDTIVESTQSDDSTACGFYKYDVTVKLAARLDSSYSDTIVAYVLHLNDSGSSFELLEDTIIANYAGNCTFTVPNVLTLRPECICGSYYYTTNLNIGDTITETCELIYEFTNFCKEEKIYEKALILVPEKPLPFASDSFFTPADAKPINSFFYFLGNTPVYNIFTEKIEFEPIKSVYINIYRNAIDTDSLVYPTEDQERYLLDRKDKSDYYYYVVKDTITGCEGVKMQYITSIDTTDAPLILSDIYEEKGDIFTISGTIVMKDVYFKDVMDRLKEGIYIFNNKKIYIRKK